LPAIVLAGGVIGALACPVVHVENSSNAAAEATAPGTSLSRNIDPSISTSIPALADPKQALLARGVNFELSYIQDTFGNVTGSVENGATYNSALYMLVEADLGKLANLPGATFRVNAFQTQGANLSTSNVYNYSTISSIAALPSTRLVELWIEQKLFADMASIRIGQLSADTEFFTSEFDALFVNGTFGWANLFAANLPGSGPGYPLATPVVRLKTTSNNHVTLLAALFNGDPAGTGFSGTERIADRHGVNFRLYPTPIRPLPALLPALRGPETQRPRAAEAPNRR
jgi:porin